MRIFTQDEARYADPATLASFEEEVSALTLQNSQVLGGYKVSEYVQVIRKYQFD